jgi:hypothetical protein
MKLIFKMAFSRLFIRLSERYIFAISKPTIFKFQILIEDYIRIHETFGFFNSLPISSEIELGFGASQIKFFLLYFISFWGFFRSLLSLVLIQCYILGVKIIKKNKMADNIKMAAKQEFSIAQYIFMQIN